VYRGDAMDLRPLLYRRVLVSASLAGLFAVGCVADDTASGDATSDDGGDVGASTGNGMATNAMTSMDADDGGTADGGADGGSTGMSPAGSSGGDGGSSGMPGDSTGAGDDESGSGDSGDSGGSTGDDGVQDSGMMEVCEAPGSLVPCDDFDAGPSIFNAIGLGCPGGPDSSIPIVNEGFNWTVPTSWAVLRQYGSYVDPVSGEPIWSAREGDTMLLLSSGYGGVPDAAGVVMNASLVNDSNGNPDGKPMPAPMTAQPGSGAAPFVGCDGVGDCSDSLAAQWAAGDSEANDLIWFQFASQVPGGTHGFSIDFAYFSEEFPEYVGTTFNDMFVVWSNSETYTGNLCFIDDEPCTVTALWPTTFQNNSPPELAQTGFSSDGATGWFQIKGSAEPLELLQLSFAVFDMGDSSWDTMVLLDNFQWDCEGCTPTEVNPCGVVDPV
jgi:hypothetical protein